MDRKSIVISVHQLKDRITGMFSEMETRFSKGLSVDVQFFFDWLPLKLSTPSAKAQLLRRGEITIKGGSQLTNVAPNGKDLVSTFEDTNFGTIIVTFGKALKATYSKTGNVSRFTMNTPIRTELYPKATVGGINVDYSLREIAYTYGQSVIYTFDDVSSPGDQLDLVVELMPPDAATDRTAIARLSIFIDLMSRDQRCEMPTTGWWVVDRSGNVDVAYHDGNGPIFGGRCGPYQTKNDADRAMAYYVIYKQCPV